MNEQIKTYQKEILTIGLPVTLQSIFQASYSFVDQLMVGSLGTTNIAASGLGAKFSSLVTFTLSSIAAVASILIAQYHGKKDNEGINNSFFSCFYILVLLLLLLAVPSMLIPDRIMGLYTNQQEVVVAAAGYLRVIAVSFFPMTVTLLMAAYFRSIEQSSYPMYASIVSMVSNILFNYLFIFGKAGFPRLGLIGAAIGTLLARILEAGILVLWQVVKRNQLKINLHPISLASWSFYQKISIIAVPIIVNEFSWSVGENIYAGIYGRLGTNALAAMTLTNPLQGMFIGMFSGLSSAAAVMVGKRLGQNERVKAYDISKYLMKVGLLGSILIGGVLALLIPFYVKLFQVDAQVEKLTCYIVYALAVVLFAKVLNMILGGGILRSGGNTRYTLIIDLIGTWIFGVPLGLFTAFVLKLPIYLVYLILSMEEVIRLIIGMIIFRKKKWMGNVTTDISYE